MVFMLLGLKMALRYLVPVGRYYLIAASTLQVAPGAVPGDCFWPKTDWYPGTCPQTPSSLTQTKPSRSWLGHWGGPLLDGLVETNDFAGKDLPW
jgi:hypothetical protein